MIFKKIEKDGDDIYGKDEHGREFCFPTSGGAFLIGVPWKRDRLWKQLEGTCDLPYRVTLERYKKALARVEEMSKIKRIKLLCGCCGYKFSGIELESRCPYCDGNDNSEIKEPLK